MKLYTGDAWLDAAVHILLTACLVAGLLWLANKTVLEMMR